MADGAKCIKINRNGEGSFGFSILGGAGTDLPPLIYDIVEGSPAAKCFQLVPGDIILEVNGKEVSSLTTKEVLNCLRVSSDELCLKLKSDPVLQAKVKHLFASSSDLDALRSAITTNDLLGVKHIYAKRDFQASSVDDKPAEVVAATGLVNKVRNAENGHSLLPKKSSEDFSTYDLKLNLTKLPTVSSYNTSNRVMIAGCSSMPSSPINTDLIETNLCQQFLESPNSVCSASSQSCSSKLGAFSYSTNSNNVRISKSEDHLQHQNDNCVVDAELDDDINSSLNTLLDTKGDFSSGSNSICVTSNCINRDDSIAKTVWTCIAPVSSPDSSLNSSHGSDSPLIESSPISPQSPTSSLQYSCAGVYNKMTNTRESPCSSNQSENFTSNTSCLTSPDTDVPDELEWDDSTPSYSPVNTTTNGFHEQLANGHALTRSASPTDSSISEIMPKRRDENRIVLKVSGPDKSFRQKAKAKSLVSCEPRKQDSHDNPVSETISPETLAYQQLWESEDDTTCISEKTDKVSAPSKSAVAIGSPPLSEDESDIDSLHSFHFNPKAVDIPSAVRLAKRLYALDGFKKSDVSRHLSRNNEFNRVVAEEYVNHFNFEKDTLDAALRKFLDKFCLTGETQERERVLVHFSKRYLDCNPCSFNSQDAVHTLTCAIMLLNTDLHSANIGRKMTAAEFTDNLAELNDGENFPKDVLKALYMSIKDEPLKWAIDEDHDGALDSKIAKNHISNTISGCGNPFLTTPAGAGVVYKKGYVMRKCCMEPQGKRTPFGKRSWKMWFCIMQDLALYLHKDEQGAKREPHPQIGQNAVRLHHALAAKANDYTKKEHVFRLETADQAEYLFQTSDNKELQVWIDSINFVAASLSAAPMAGAVGSQRKFQRPLLPCGLTKLNLAEQLNDHTKRLANFERDLEEHRKAPPEKTAKSSFLSNYKEKESYLIYEIQRYQTYVYLLKSKLDSESSGSFSGNLEMTELPVFEARKSSDPSNGQNTVVPPPIPHRRTDSDGSNDEETPIRGKERSASNPDISKTKNETVSSPKKKNQLRSISRRNSSAGDYQNELKKMLKEQEKRKKKFELKEAKAERERQKKILQGHKGKDPVKKKNPQPCASEKETKFIEDPRVGTFNRMSALFSFRRLNSTKSSCELETQETGNVEQLELNDKPPPLPPKPAASSLVRKQQGTRIDI